jgi:hypothetical protein|tara:strand:- start:78 stop:443 length:366 start_codon:yes stop_codon:yes gene_type:complete
VPVKELYRRHGETATFSTESAENGLSEKPEASLLASPSEAVAQLRHQIAQFAITHRVCMNIVIQPHEIKGGIFKSFLSGPVESNTSPKTGNATFTFAPGRAQSRPVQLPVANKSPAFNGRF